MFADTILIFGGLLGDVLRDAPSLLSVSDALKKPRLWDHSETLLLKSVSEKQRLRRRMQDAPS